MKHLNSAFIDWITLFIADREDLPFKRSICDSFFSTGEQLPYTISYNAFGYLFTISGSKFRYDNWKDDLTFIENNFKKLPLFLRKEEISISRLDIAVNFPPIKLKEWTIDVTARQYTPYYNHGELTGLNIGTRNKNTLFTRVYLKSIDPERFSSYERFGSTDFMRLEYEIRSGLLRPLGISPLNYKEIHNINIPKIWNYCRNKHDIRPPNTHVETYPVFLPKLSTNYQYARKTATSIILKYCDIKEWNQIKDEIDPLMPNKVK